MSLAPFERVVDEHGAAILRVCTALLGPGDAEDAWSETFLAALGAYPRLRASSNVRAWLVTIAQRKAIDRIRAQRRVPVPLEQISETAADWIEDRPRDPDLWQALSRLPEKQRAAIAFHYLGDLPYAEVAKLLDSSEAAARRAAADGMTSLRRALSVEVLL